MPAFYPTTDRASYQSPPLRRHRIQRSTSNPERQTSSERASFKNRRAVPSSKLHQDCLKDINRPNNKMPELKVSEERKAFFETDDSQPTKDKSTICVSRQVYEEIGPEAFMNIVAEQGHDDILVIDEERQLKLKYMPLTNGSCKVEIPLLGKSKTYKANECYNIFARAQKYGHVVSSPFKTKKKSGATIDPDLTRTLAQLSGANASKQAFADANDYQETNADASELASRLAEEEISKKLTAEFVARATGTLKSAKRPIEKRFADPTVSSSAKRHKQQGLQFKDAPIPKSKIADDDMAAAIAKDLELSREIRRKRAARCF